MCTQLIQFLVFLSIYSPPPEGKMSNGFTLDKCKPLGDIVLLMRDNSLCIVWEFLNGGIWPLENEEGWETETEMKMLLSKECEDLTPKTTADARGLVMAMRQAYEKNLAQFTSRSCPSSFPAEMIRYFVLKTLDASIEQDDSTFKKLEK
jgi:hypothetical protein